MDYIKRLAPDFIELHGDRLSAMTPRWSAASARGTAARRCFSPSEGPQPEERWAELGNDASEGYRKAIRLAHHAAKFGFADRLADRPLPAQSRRGAEEARHRRAIAEAIMEWFRIPVPSWPP